LPKLKKPGLKRKKGKVARRGGMEVFITGRTKGPTAGQWTAMALSDKLTIPIPARPYMRPALIESYDSIIKIMDLQK
jgi:hypothetical protein